MGSDVLHTLRAHFRYREEREEIVRTPEFMLADLARFGYIEGDCDDISTLVGAVLTVLGIPARFVATIYTPGVVNYQHVFVEAAIDGGWHVIDLTIDPGARQTWIHRMVEVI